MEEEYVLDSYNYTDYNFTYCLNMTMEECRLGPQRDPLHRLPMPLFHLFLMTGVIGNICTCIVIAKPIHATQPIIISSVWLYRSSALFWGFPQELTYGIGPIHFGEPFYLWDDL
ncbi:pyrokinin-1 receptor [Trichonephila inaurata madagascariensis]|uniref:Pyrokinin-1 receptor n=1 Tax=Trichonephila inaurata madagascariensis TaxID=2747483 RepID=A0A8X6YJ86_9ARAC|nr:pyrokinin-1 receptor [Trichonephila inaurata madagascariensis]